MRHALPSVALVLVVCIALAPALSGGTVAAAPPPEPLCGLCGDSFDGATDRGTLDVHLEDDGDSRWIERLPLTESAADRYREDPDELERAVEERWARYHVADGDVTERTIALEDDTLVVSYTVTDVARPGVGDGWIVDYFAAGESKTRYAVVAERVSIHPPDGHELTTRPTGATIRDGAATWRGPTDDGDGDGDDFDRQTYLTYGPESGAVATAAGRTTVAIETGPLRLQHAALGGLPAAVVLAVGAVTVGRTGETTPGIGRVERRLNALETERFGRFVVGLGLVGAVGALVLGVLQVGTPAAPGAVALAAAALAYGAFGAIALSVGHRLPGRGALAATLALTGGAAGLATLIAGWPFRPTPIAFLLSAGAFLPLGVALDRGSARWPALALSLAGPFVLVAAVAPVGSFPTGPLIVGLLLVPAAAFTAAVGYPLAVLGRKVAAENGSDGTKRPR